MSSKKEKPTYTPLGAGSIREILTHLGAEGDPVQEVFPCPHCQGALEHPTVCAEELLDSMDSDYTHINEAPVIVFTSRDGSRQAGTLIDMAIDRLQSCRVQPTKE